MVRSKINHKTWDMHNHSQEIKRKHFLFYLHKATSIYPMNLFFKLLASLACKPRLQGHILIKFQGMRALLFKNKDVAMWYTKYMEWNTIQFKPWNFHAIFWGKKKKKVTVRSWSRNRIVLNSTLDVNTTRMYCYWLSI